MPDDPTTHAPMIARIAGGVLRAVFAAILLVRRPRPIHSRGVILRGDIRWLGNTVRSGVRWVDEPPAQPLPVVARWSRSVGLPEVFPDIHGLALRFDADGEPADIELASTGAGVPLRYALLPHWSPARAHFNTLLPYRGTHGPRLIGARTLTPRSFPRGIPSRIWKLRLYFAGPAGKWHPFAELTLRPTDEDDSPDLRFDAARHPLPGATTYGWTRALRQPSYRLAQATTPIEARAAV